MYLGIEIGGTKLQLGLGLGDGQIVALWRGTVNPAEGGEGIRKQIVAAVPELLAKANLDHAHLRGVGIGFGGPTDDATRTVIKSHQIAGWDGFPLADWVSDLVGVPAVLCNDADVAGLAEALFGAGKGLSPVFYMTIGSGIGGGLIIDGQIYRGVGRGAAEIGHYVVWKRTNGEPDLTTESLASGWAIQRFAQLSDIPSNGEPVTTKTVADAARAGNSQAIQILSTATDAVAMAIAQLITFVCPRRVVIGGGVSLIGEELFFKPIRDKVAARVFPPFAGLTDIVPAALGEEVVVHGALALARQKLGEPTNPVPTFDYDGMKRGFEEAMAAAGETPERQAARDARMAELCAKYPGQFAAIREEWDGARIIEPFLLAVGPDATAAERALKSHPPELVAGAEIEYLMPPNRAIATPFWFST